MLVYRTKYYAGITNYDRYNNLRGMTDSDVLAEDKLKNPYTAGKVVSNTAMGAATGATIGAMTNLFRPGKTVLRGGKTGAILGGVGSAAYSMFKRSREGDKISEYNSRLDDAQRLASRRERMDWYRDQRGRTDYTY